MVGIAHLFLLPIVSCALNLRALGYMEEDPLGTQRLVHIAKRLKHRLGSSVVTVVTTRDARLSTLQTIQEAIGSVQVSDFGSLSSKLNLCFFENNEDIFGVTKNDGFWDPDSYYVLYFKTFKPQTKKIFHYLWYKHFVHKAFIVSRNVENVEAFNPILKMVKNTSIRNFEVLIRRELPDCNQTYFYTLFAELYVENKHKYSRNFLVDGFSLRVISEKLNARLKIVNNTDQSTKFGYRSKNGTFHGTFRQLSERRVNMSFNVHFMKHSNIFDKLTYSVYVRTDKICIALPKTEQIPKFVESFKSFNVTVWLSILSMYTATAATLKILRYCFSSANDKLINNVNVPLVFYGISLGIPVIYRPRLYFEKLILGAILLASLVVWSILQCTLNAILSTPPSYYKIPNTKEELNKMKVLIQTSSQDLIDSYKAAGFTGIRFHLKTLEEQLKDLEDPYYDIGILEKVAAVIDPGALRYLRSKQLQLSQACPVKNFQAHIFPKGSPFEGPVNRILSNLVESGIMVKWDYLVYENSNRTMEYVYKHRELAEVRPLGMEDLGGPILYCSCWGFGAASAAFVLELLVHEAKKKFQNKNLITYVKPKE